MYVHAVVLLSVADQLGGVPSSLGEKRRNPRVADLREGYRGPNPPPPLILAEGRKASRASKLKPHPLLSSKSRSATVTEGRKASRRRKTIPTLIPHPTPWSATGYSVIMSGCSHCKHNHYDVMYILLIVLPLCRQSELGSTIIVCIATDINLWLNCDLKKSRAESQ